MILLCALLFYFNTKMINLIELYKTIKQNGDHLIFYQYCVYALFSLVRLAVIIRAVNEYSSLDRRVDLC